MHGSGSQAPHAPVTDLNGRERTILVILVASIFWLGIFPDGALRKTELAARDYQQLVGQKRTGPAMPAVPAGEKR